MIMTVFSHNGALYQCDLLLSKIQRIDSKFGFIRVSAPSMSLLNSARVAVAKINGGAK